MIKMLVIFCRFWLTLTLNRISVSCFEVVASSSVSSTIITGNSMMLPCGFAFCRHTSFGKRRKFYHGTSAVVRRMCSMELSSADIIDTGSASVSTPLRSKEALSSLPGNLEPWFDISLPEGRCIGVETTNETDCFPQDHLDGTAVIESDHWLRSVFHEDEVDFGMRLKKTRNSFWLGRLALRIALDFPEYPILKDDYGRPQLEGEFFASISHKQHKGVAIVSPPLTDSCNSNILSGVGIDLELTSRPGRSNIAKRILTANEVQSLGNLPGVTADEEVLLRFSLKEAIYKAAHPLLRQYVGFQEAEVRPYSDGTASCTWLLDSNADNRIAKLTAHWERLDKYFLTSASVYSKSKKIPS